MLFIRCYRKKLVGPNLKCSNVVLILLKQPHALVIRASQVMQQVFITCVPDVVNRGHPWVSVLRYTSSSYQAMLDDVDAQLVDDDLKPIM